MSIFVRVGVSIDGDREAHDRYRLDHRSQSTFDRTEQNIRRLVAWAGDEKPLVPATISVLDCRNDYRRIYAYLRGLGIEQMSFLLPDRNIDSGFATREASGKAYGHSLLEIFEAWLTEDNPDIFVRYIRETLEYFQIVSHEHPDGRIFEAGSWAAPTGKKLYQIVIVQSDGTVSVNDSYIPALSWYEKTPVYSVFRNSLRDFLSDGIFAEIARVTANLPAECSACRWKRLCRGGDLENRFSEKNGFDNPSVYCEAYKTFYHDVCDLLVRNGYPMERVQSQVFARATSSL